MLKTISLMKSLGDKPILQNINITVKEGEALGIIGPNGAGKSTFLKIIAGLLKPTDGQVWFHHLNMLEHINEVKKKIGFLAHNSYLYEELSPLENLIFYAELYQIHNVKEKAKYLLEEVGLTLFMNEPVRTFSRGMVQRLAIARTMIHSPELLLLDEPHTGLDQSASEFLNDMIARMKEQKKTVIMVTHDFHQAVEACDRLLVFNHGKVVEDFQIVNRDVEWIKEKYLHQVGSL